MCDDSGSSSGPFEVRQQNSSAPSPPMWSKSNTQSNNRMYDNSGNNMNRMPSSSFDNRSNNYYNNSNMNSNRGGFGPSSSMDNNSGNLDYNTACRMVYERFLNEGFNPKLAKERTLEFLSNMQGRSNHTGFTNNNISDYFDQTQRGGGGGMFSNNSDFFGPGQGMMNANNNGNFGRFNDNNNWGGNNGGGGSWGSFNGPNNNMQMPSSWGGGGGGMPYNTQGNNFNNRSRRDGWNNQNMVIKQFCIFS